MKQRYAYFMIALIIAGSLLYGCREPREQEAPTPLFAEFYVRYLQAERELKAHASFFEGDSIQAATPKAFAEGAAFQGNSMEPRTLPGGTLRYTFEQPGTYADTFRFSFRDDLGRGRQVLVAMAPIDSFAVTGGQASKSSGMALYARGGKLERGESMILLFNDEKNQAATIMLTGPSAGENYRIPAAKVEKLSSGKNTLYLVKKKRATQKEDGLSALTDIEFYTNTIEVEVTD
ncbi:MAG: hypothetical protein H6560_08625 [Lewinellaceae bacterium]|nr:hypothetical protein [Lewinellaceae bacterium]